MRLGILGGTFDPPHVGHLLAASDAFEFLALDRLLFVPAGRQPFKVGVVEATGEQRVEMLRAMIRDDPRFEVDPVEIRRPGLSYTVDTLSEIAVRFPDAELYLLIGEDLAEQLRSWREPERIAGLARVVVLTRVGDDPAPSAADGALRELRLERLATRRVDVSSTEIRARTRAGRSVRGFVPDDVVTYIETSRLYR
ncbi:MAG: nicotinate-nucleotide adenylyltransferase [Gemmatimonadaceae bacterium]